MNAKRGILNIITLIIIAINGYGQNCKIEFYLLKRVIVSDSINSAFMVSDFHVTIDDVEDTPFISDNEITSFFIRKDTTNFKIRERHHFVVPNTVINRIKELNIPLCCGKQFALLVNGEIVYGGYFWNLASSFGCNGIGAFAYNNQITIYKQLPDLDRFENNVSDMRQNPNLFDCLKTTNRMND